MLAVGEACNNAVEHGHVEDGEFVVTCEFVDGSLRIEIADSGRGFDDAGSSGSSSGEYIGRGRGISIMRALMDEVECRRSPAGMTIALVKRLSSGRVDEPARESGGIDAGGRGQTR